MPEEAMQKSHSDAALPRRVSFSGLEAGASAGKNLWLPRFEQGKRAFRYLPCPGDFS
jgi:hypothetical protein